jgi:hypothetical protein
MHGSGLKEMKTIYSQIGNSIVQGTGQEFIHGHDFLVEILKSYGNIVIFRTGEMKIL